MLRRAKSLAVLAAVAMLLVACGGQKPAAPAAPAAAPAAAPTAAPAAAPAAPKQEAPKPRVKLRAGQTVDAIALLPMYVAKGKQLLEAEGFDVEWSTSSGTVTVGQMVDTKSIDVAFEAPSTVISMISKGRPIRMIQNLQNGSTQVIIANTKVAAELGIDPKQPLQKKLDTIKAYIQKKGKVKWAISRPNSASDIYARRFVKDMGLTVGKDVEIVASGGAGQIGAAIDNGAVEFAMLWPPNDAMLYVKGTAKPLVFVALEIEEYGISPNEVTLVHQDTIKNNPEMVKGIGRALAKANQLTHTLSINELTDIVAKYLPDQEKAVLKSGVELVQPMVPRDSKFTEKGMDALMVQLVASGSIPKVMKMSEVATNEFLP